MKTTGMIRTIDKLGRVVIPSEYRKFLNINPDEEVEVILTSDGVLLRKFEPYCVLCGKKTALSEIGTSHLCRDCIEVAKRL
ncbi:MAG: AbrB/MazE/SpoVT family DNA-binding domain-containing protein [Oscillospiraceae bacterium]|nr:AbrB/MazE/SpoVT family DNA-binding domain-containing protein [Oscillospiraceae bacterium]